jgi:hypothetical protein
MNEMPVINSIISLYKQAHNNVICKIEEEPHLLTYHSKEMAVLNLSVMVHNEYNLLLKLSKIPITHPSKFQYKDKIKNISTGEVLIVIGTPPKIKIKGSNELAYLLTSGSEDFVQLQSDVEDGTYVLYITVNHNYNLNL